MKYSTDKTLLKFSPGNKNAKLQQIKGKLYSFSLPSGFSCPAALECLSKAMKQADGSYSTVDGKHTKYRCFSATQEMVFPTVRLQREHNFSLIRQCRGAEAMKELIIKSIPKGATIIRIHVGGDFYNKEYMKAWLLVAQELPNIIFYSYTKSLNYWIELINEIPSNFKMNASRSGKFDHLIEQYNLKSARVVYSEQEAKDLGLEIDHDDTHAFMKDESFALLIHGMQPKGSEASKARSALKRADKGQYNRKKIKEEMKSPSYAEITQTAMDSYKADHKLKHPDMPNYYSIITPRTTNEIQQVSTN